MFGALQSLTGGGGMSGGAGTTGDMKTDTDQSTEAGRVVNGGITINPSAKFDYENPMHIGAAGVALLIVSLVAIKAVK